MTDPAAGLAPQEFLVAVAAELEGQPPSVRPKLFQHVNDVGGGQRLQAIEPDVAGDMVDKEQAISEAELADSVPVDDVQMDLVQVVLGARENSTSLSLLEGGKLTDGGAGLTALYKLRIFRRGTKVLVVPEASVVKETVDPV